MIESLNGSCSALVFSNATCVSASTMVNSLFFVDTKHRNGMDNKRKWSNLVIVVFLLSASQYGKLPINNEWTFSITPYVSDPTPRPMLPLLYAH